MDEIGHILREAREGKGLTLDEAQSQTRINARYLQALESGDYAALPSPVHVRGFLRNYARYLGLDPRPLIERYQAVQGQQVSLVPGIEGEISPDNPLPDRQDQPFFDPVNMEVQARSWGGGGSEGILQLVIIAALLIALILVGMRFIPLILGRDGNGNAVEEISSAVQDVVADVTGATATPTVDVNSIAADSAQSGFVIGGTPVGDPSTSRNAFPTPTPTRPSLPAVMEEIRLKLDILERTWLEVTIDGDVVFSGIARANDALEWTAQEEAKILTGNAAGVFATVNDIALGRLGGRGERHEEVWRTTP